MGRYALLVGNSDYPGRSGLPPLATPPADVEAVNRALSLRGGFDVTTVLDGDREKIFVALNSLFSGRSAEDTVLVYFSCHGVLHEDDDRLYFASHDTEEGQLDATAVDAERVHQLMRNCRAGRKIALLDCCYSGSFGEGTAVRRSGLRQRIERRVRTRGTFVLTACTKLESAYEPKPGEGSLSYFTQALVEGMEGGVSDRDGDGWITVQDLADFVQNRMADRKREQSPSCFSEGVTGQIPIARVASSAEPDVGGASGASTARSATEDVFDWRRLLSYYRDCLATEVALETLIPLNATDRYQVWPGGPEPVFSGGGGPLPVPGGARRLVPHGSDDQKTLVYGYPAVVVDQPRKAKIAPLFEVEVDVDAQGRLRAFAEPHLNRSLLKHLGLSDDQTEELAEHVADNLVLGRAEQLTMLAEQVAKIVDVPVRGRLDAARLADELRLTPFQKGVQNVALLYQADAREDRTVRGLLEDYDKLLLPEVPHVGETALGALRGERRTEQSRPWQLVAPMPLNEAQERIVAAAMNERLTVATGPPGTGKSQLVTALVATAVAAGRTVLVASTNNKAVDEVKRRCDELAPGLLVRTGAQRYRAEEPDVLATLLDTYRTPGDDETARAQSRIARDDLNRRRLGLDQRHALERELADLVTSRREAREPFAGRSEVLALAEDHSAPESWLPRVRRARRPWLGWVARFRIERALGVRADRLMDLERFLTTEREWHQARVEETRLPDEAQLWHAAATLAVSAIPRQDADSVREHLAVRLTRPGNRRLVENRIQLLRRDPNKSWTGFRDLLAAAPGWATTAHSARGLLPRRGLFDLVIIDEAAQCPAAVVLPLLYRARSALLIGDPHQIPPVVNLTAGDEKPIAARHGFSTRWLHESRLSHTTSTAYDAFAAAASETFLLDEHYRCHPDIIEVPNREIYGGRLAVLTDPRRLAGRMEPAVRWQDVKGAVEVPARGSARNRAEAQAVREAVESLRTEYPNAEIGVVTPFAPQVELLKSLLADLGVSEEQIGTVHRYQGGERDFMVLSPVGSVGISRYQRNWLVTQNDLWNVAITRARAGLVIVGDREWWSGQRGLLTTLATAGERSDAASDPARTEAADRLHAELSGRGATVRRSATVGGQRCDLLVEAGERIAVFLDMADEYTSGRTLRQALARIDLVEGQGVRAVRIPGWRCLAEPSSAADLVLRRAARA
ncbi:hypothetical protein GCM10009678_24100 [Actinomadura kijaniata]|uniref:EF-hand domain-containing protein n=1 Tax=Actinomadura namibiensis TaxID=182080 RepID=A0A7W3LP34_ACTNM|nr:AAA domain-containing protein [Actinomadura namibiensis]MBA8951698.1 hypothetical protein [Actinomadura namibiensis]